MKPIRVALIKMYRVAIFDLDGTLVRHDTFLPFLILTLISRPTRWVRIPLLGAGLVLYLLGQKNNSWLKETFMKHIVGGLLYKRAQKLFEIYAILVVKLLVSKSALAEIELQRSRGACLVLATASPNVYVESIAKILKINNVICTMLEKSSDGILTGNIFGSNCYGAEKFRKVEAFLMENKHIWDGTICYSDHISDLSLLLVSQKGVAVNPCGSFRRLCIDQKIDIVRWT